MSIFEGKDKRMLALAMALGVVNSVASAFVAILLQQVLDVAVRGDGAGFWRLCQIMAGYVLILAALSFAESLCGKVLLRGVTTAYATPAASSQAALIFGNEKWVARKDAYLTGILVLICAFIVLLGIGIPLGNVMF